MIDMQLPSLVWWGVIGVLLGIGFVVPFLWWLAVVGAALTAWRLLLQETTKILFGGLCLSWLIKYAMALLWFWSTYPIEWLPLQAGFWQMVLIFVYWSTAALWLAGGVLVLGGGWWLLGRLLPQVSVQMRLLIFPVLWVWAEIAGSVLFSLFSLGPGGVVNAKFSFGYSGYLLAEHHTLLQLASWGGVYMLSFLVAGFGVGIYLAWSKQYGRTFVLLTLALMLVTTQTNHRTLNTAAGYAVAVIDTAFPPQVLGTDDGRTAELQEAVSAAIDTKAEYIILPEDARYVPASTISQKQALTQIQNQLAGRATVLVDSGQVWRGEQSVLQATIYNGHTKQFESVDKRYLVPQGEYTPTLYKGALQLFGQSDIVSYIERSRGYVVGENTDQSQLSAPIPAMLFCFESADPMGVRSAVAGRPAVPFVSHIVSHAWFHTPGQLWRQLDRMLQVQAVWNDQYIVSAGNQMTGAVYTPSGVIARQQPIATGDRWQVRLVTIPR